MGTNERLEPKNLTVGKKRSAPSAQGWIFYLLAGVLLSCLSGCAVPNTVEGVRTLEQLNQILRDRGLEEPQRLVLPYALNDEIRSWLREKVPAELSGEEKLKRLRDELIENRIRPLEYIWGYTGSAVEVFATGEANCLAFTNLFLGMARELGVEVYFLLVEDVETYRKEGDLVVISDHIAVGYEVGPQNTLLFDFSEFGEQDHDRVRRVEDETAIAMYYSNRGAEALQRGALEEALQWLESAVLLDPEWGNGWVNLGVALRRSGDLVEAEKNYRQALEVDPGSVSAYQNLVAMLRSSGQHEEAEVYERAMREAPRTRNPYTYLALGDISYNRGRRQEARRLYRRALALSQGNPEILAALGHLALAEGDLPEARRLLRKARRADPEQTRVVRLEKLVEQARDS